ncbi:hypothetical protein MTR67_039548 [Solanum verrucosum]|uniref:HECT-type E3 ubiquitin transferase n=1 Tax=Solanum verrucosum TaxID=315347 RepID=A0AAF0UH34_SOLVR|nr:hypothetical protein MTR67_039548 [Solanum verrucosum]
MQSTEFIELSESDVQEFIKFMHLVKIPIRHQEAFDIPVSFPSLMQGGAGNERLEIEGVHRVFLDLLEKLELCLKKLESQLGLINKERGLVCLKNHLSTLDMRVLGHYEASYLCNLRMKKLMGPGVLREWFSLVCEAIFNPQNALFVSFPNEGRRFFPNPTSKVDRLHLEYFIFSGRMIALALLHRVQISIAFDCVFFLQLAGEDISFEDIRDANPYLYNGCKKILEMDTKMVDEDILGLTFVCEDEELGSRKVVELCRNGKNTIVNSENRITMLILLLNIILSHQLLIRCGIFLNSFKVIIPAAFSKFSFLLLHIVGSMLAEQRNVLLFFWTSIKSLSIGGFGGLDSKLYICQTLDSHDCLPPVFSSLSVYGCHAKSF